MGFGAGWYYNDVSGDVVHASALTSIGEGLVPGWHGPYATEAEALAHKGISGAPAQANESVTGSASGSLANTVQNLISGKSGQNLVVRGVEILAGLALIYAGAKAMLTPAGQSVANRTMKATRQSAKSAFRQSSAAIQYTAERPRKQPAKRPTGQNIPRKYQREHRRLANTG